MNFRSDQPDKPDRRNRPDEPAFVGRAQWKINQPPSLERNEQAWRGNLYRSMRAVEGSLGHSPQERFRELEEPISRRAVGKPSGSTRLARLARRSCSFGSSGLSGFSSFFGSPDGFSGSANKTDQIDQINKMDQSNHVSRQRNYARSKEQAIQPSLGPLLRFEIQGVALAA